MELTIRKATVDILLLPFRSRRTETSNTETVKEYKIIPGHPLAPLVGKYNNEPLWDDFLAAIQEARREADERENV